MNDKPKPFRQKYGFIFLEVGEAALIHVLTKRQELNARKAAHNLNGRTDKHFSTRLDGDTLIVTRIR